MYAGRYTAAGLLGMQVGYACCARLRSQQARERAKQVTTSGSIMHATSLHWPPTQYPGRDNSGCKVEEQQSSPGSAALCLVRCKAPQRARHRADRLAVRVFVVGLRPAVRHCAAGQRGQQAALVRVQAPEQAVRARDRCRAADVAVRRAAHRDVGGRRGARCEAASLGQVPRPLPFQPVLTCTSAAWALLENMIRSTTAW